MGKFTEKYEENKTKGKFLQVQCIECKRDTRHQVIQSLDYSGSEVFDGGEFSVDWISNHQIIQCQGCMNVTFRRSHWFSEDEFQIGPNEWKNGVREILFPKRTKYTIPILKVG